MSDIDPETWTKKYEGKIPLATDTGEAAEFYRSDYCEHFGQEYLRISNVYFERGKRLRKERQEKERQEKQAALDAASKVPDYKRGDVIEWVPPGTWVTRNTRYVILDDRWMLGIQGGVKGLKFLRPARPTSAFRLVPPAEILAEIVSPGRPIFQPGDVLCFDNGKGSLSDHRWVVLPDGGLVGITRPFGMIASWAWTPSLYRLANE